MKLSSIDRISFTENSSTSFVLNFAVVFGTQIHHTFKSIELYDNSTNFTLLRLSLLREQISCTCMRECVTYMLFNCRCVYRGEHDLSSCATVLYMLTHTHTIYIAW